MNAQINGNEQEVLLEKVDVAGPATNHGVINAILAAPLSAREASALNQPSVKQATEGVHFGLLFRVVSLQRRIQQHPLDAKIDDAVVQVFTVLQTPHVSLGDSDHILQRKRKEERGKKKGVQSRE